MTLLRLALALLILAPGAAAADEFVIPDAAYPKLPAHAASADGFTPPGWRVEFKSEGDLNGDGKADVALVLRQHSPRNVLDNAGNIGPDRLDTNPRLLVAALRGPSGGYDLALQNHTLIPRTTEPNLDDYLSEEGMQIARGALKVTLHLFSSAGGWGMGHRTYSFRLRGGRFALVGYDSVTVERNTGEMNELSADYLTGKVKHTAGTIETDTTKVRWTRLRVRPLLTIERIGDGMDFDPEHAR
jgi:hypothetical protein